MLFTSVPVYYLLTIGAKKSAMACRPEGAYNTGGKRNVIVVGKIGSGKSTLANKIICSDDVFIIGDQFHAVTEQVTNVIESVNIEGKHYLINMIDTVGLRDTGTKSDNEIMKEVKKELRARAPEGLNLIIFVFKHGRFTKEEMKVFRKISENFTDVIQDFSLLVITNCDRKSRNAREDIVRKFKEDSLTKNFGAMMRKGIHCVGLPDVKDLNEQEMPSAIEEMKEDMIPIHRAIAEAREMHLQEQIQKRVYVQYFELRYNTVS